MSEKSLLEYAYDVLAKSPKAMQFPELCKETLKLSGLKVTGDELKMKLSRLYTQLSLDGRFVTLKDNYLDLRSRHVFDDCHVAMDYVYSDVEEETESDDLEEVADRKAELGEEEELEDGKDVADSSLEDEDDPDFDKPRKSKDDEDY